MKLADARSLEKPNVLSAPVEALREAAGDPAERPQGRAQNARDRRFLGNAVA